MASHIQLGEKGEEMAMAFLRGKGYKILETNWRSGKLELDIIAKKDEEYIFVEVKTRSSEFEIEELITPSKEASLMRAVNVYLEELEEEVSSRVDLILLQIHDGELQIEHLENAIDPW